MKRTTNVVVTLALLSITPFILAQEPLPTLPSDILGPQLIAWSQQQKPQPVPQPLPDPPPQQQQSKQPEQQPANSQAQPQPDVGTFAGKIVINLGKYVLKISNDNDNDNVYQLDDQDAAKEYEGKEVKLVGTLDESSHSIRITSIQVIS
jgi:hypothetical protein